ncbi:Nucleolysin TIAR [Apophysomyces sp. BC1034]|nr:Nucleolysin TIAR [Apophysomyces sp. BC1021]KAG0188140.1 Nucleolysin TIAR [Apophysomyces sp. BC1034]
MTYHEPVNGGCKALYVGHLDSRVSDHMLSKIFSAFGHVKSVKVIPDKNEIKVNWAAQGSTQKDDTSNHFHIFVGDLSPEVSDDVLSKAFGIFNSMS